MYFPSRESIEALSVEEKIQKLKDLRISNQIVEMAAGFGFANSSSYYNWLRRMGIYDDLCSTYRVRPNHDLVTTKTYTSKEVITVSDDQINIEYDVLKDGAAAAKLLEKVSRYLEDENGKFEIQLIIKKK
ncbi:hypothetical protein M5X00_13250 [Paenibacillus alvei]|uniref:hypothetical protein n=1 Tax=Paenibacillus alvei TaxID=44250 RepID=UPI00227FF2C4|nr:hypothetical protein [Paenibacillus alvei]MCY9540510.1 hypothetical protein [Paenibacillus alvei]MCY9708286.1 hypothetical protein [Paenibacillus alvei]MCY9732919.1 hypothetical protein [Paenibacillus alvei]MCY9755207.1 hypothetical protein [Paenibacillus alvei]MEC0080315.1 hypothetical protein [Paenibacillus alvei]